MGGDDKQEGRQGKKQKPATVYSCLFGIQIGPAAFCFCKVVAFQTANLFQAAKLFLAKVLVVEILGSSLWTGESFPL